MAIIVNSDRALKWLSFAKGLLRTIKELGLMSAARIVDGYRIRVSRIDDALTKINIQAPPGAVVCSIKGGQYQYQYADLYGGNFAKIKDRLPADGVIPSIPIAQAGGDLIFLASSDYHAPISQYGTLFAAWYAPRPTFPADVTATDGYLAGAFVIHQSNPSVPTGGYVFTQNGVMFGVSTVSVLNETSGFGGFSAVAVRANTSIQLGVSSLPVNGKGLFCRPVFGTHEMIVSVVTPSAGDDPQIRFFWLDLDAETMTADSFGYIGGVTKSALRAPMGLALDSEVPAALEALIDSPTWPFYQTFDHGVFSVGTYAVCYWGVTPDYTGGIIVSYTGAVQAVSVTFPAHDNSVLHALTTEIYPSVYCCQLWDYTTDELSGVFIGTPFSGGAWVAVPVLAGTWLRYTPIIVDTNVVVHMAIVWTGDDETVLFVYDPRMDTPAWRVTGVIGEGKVTYPWATIFGEHEYAKALSDNHYLHPLAP